jgi:hypothetical protein
MQQQTPAPAKPMLTRAGARQQAYASIGSQLGALPAGASPYAKPEPAEPPPAPGTGFKMPSAQDLRAQYPGFVSLVKAGAFGRGGLQPDTFFAGTPATAHSTSVPGGPLYDFIFADGGHTLAVLRNNNPVMSTLFSTAQGETFLYCMTNGSTFKADLRWEDTGCFLQVHTVRTHPYDITRALIAWHLRRADTGQ